jgi:spore coat protein A
MKLTRRDALKLGIALPFASACLSQRPEARLLSSRTPLPRPFEVPLPRAAVLAPVRTDGTTDYHEITVHPAPAKILPGLTTQVWGYNGTFPGPTIEARAGRCVSLHLRNELPVPIAHHLHGGRTPPESDGYPTDLVLPVGGFPHPLPHDPRARVAQDSRDYVYPNQQRAATLWYHDHRMDFTAPQVWRGLAGFYILRDDEEQQLPLPRGDREIAMVICDRSFDADGSFLYPSVDPSLREKMGVPPEYAGGVQGDVILVNGAPWPVLEVSNVKYRFRILNASNARRFELALDPAPAGGRGLIQIGSDGGLLGAPIAHSSIRMSQSERFDVIVDFARYPAGSKITLRNLLDSGPAGQIMQFHVTRAERDDTHIPERLSNYEPPDHATAQTTRHFRFSYRRGMSSWTINGKPFDPDRMDARPLLGATEIWQMETDFNHPLHLHLVHFRVLGHSGRPGPWDAGWKDTIDLGPGATANLLVRFEGYRGRYVFHCHNLEHEDMGMMANFEVV